MELMDRRRFLLTVAGAVAAPLAAGRSRLGRRWARARVARAHFTIAA